MGVEPYVTYDCAGDDCSGTLARYPKGWYVCDVCGEIYNHPLVSVPLSIGERATDEWFEGRTEL